MSEALGYWVDGPGEGSVQKIPLVEPDVDSLILRATHTGISPGTERLVGLGRVPSSCHAAMACRGMMGSFQLPTLYGYSFVGEVEFGEHAGRRAFAMRPHQTRAVIAVEELQWLPDAVPSARATLFPNLETARNAVWDAAPTDDDDIVVIGAGAVGLLVAFVVAHEHTGGTTIVDIDPARREFAASLPWVSRALHPDEVARGTSQHAFHATATAAGLQLAIDAVGFEGVVTELSWYGDKPVEVHLGGDFHYQRKRICASQVGSIAPSHREAGYRARAASVMQLLTDKALDRLLAEPIPFAELPSAFAQLYAGQLTAPCPFVDYSNLG